MTTQRMLPGGFSERAAVTAFPRRRRPDETPPRTDATPPTRDAGDSRANDATALDHADGRQHATTLDRYR